METKSSYSLLFFIIIHHYIDKGSKHSFSAHGLDLIKHFLLFKADERTHEKIRSRYVQRCVIKIIRFRLIFSTHCTLRGLIMVIKKCFGYRCVIIHSNYVDFQYRYHRRVDYSYIDTRWSAYTNEILITVSYRLLFKNITNYTCTSRVQFR